MGFFYEDAVAELAIKRVTTKKSTKTKSPPISTGERGCDACSLRAEWPRITSPRMTMRGNTVDADILCIGEFPNEAEDMRGEVFAGTTGKLIRDLIPGRFMDRITMTNSVRCRPFAERIPTDREVYACGSHLEDDLRKLPIKAILGAGAVPLSKFVTETSIVNIHGNRLPVRIGDKVMWYYPVMHPSFVLRLQKENGYDGPAMPVFKADMKRFFRQVDTWEEPVIETVPTVLVPTSRKEAEALLNQMQPPFGVDLETFSPTPGIPKPYHKGAKLLTASVSDGKTTFAFPIDSLQAQTDWGLPFLLWLVATYNWVAHNSAYELVWLLHMSQQHRLPPPKLFEDSMAILRLYHGSERLLSLAVGSRIHLGVNVKYTTAVNPDRIWESDLSDVLKYNGYDSWASVRIWQKLVQKVDEEHYTELLDRIESTTRMELLGLHVDQAEVKKLHDKWGGIAATAERDASRIYEVKEFVRHHSREFRIGSPVDVGTALVKFGRMALPPTKGGGKGGTPQYSTDDQVLNAIAPDHPLVKNTLAYREAVKLDSTYCVPFAEMPAANSDGLLHPSYSVLLVSTYRSSSENPNIQNVPKRKHREIRTPIKAPPKHVMVAIDYGQMQVRNLCMASRDRNLRTALMTPGFDMHSHWLDRLLLIHHNYLDHLVDKTGEKDEKKIRKAGRDIIKSDFVFNSFFGGGADNVCNRTGIPLLKVQRLQADLWDEYKGVRDWQKERRREYAETGTVIGMTGVVLGRVMKSGNEPINYPIQDLEAEFVFRAQNELSQMSLRENDLYLHPRINVHDDLTFILPNDDRLISYIDRITAIMTKVRFPFQNVPLVVEVKVGENWCDLHEVTVVTGGYVNSNGTR